MIRIAQAFRCLAIAALCLTAAGTAAADPTCLNVHSRFSLQVATEGCTSPIALCAVGEYRGSLRGNSEFTGTSFVPTVDTPETGVAVVTGDNVIHTPSGDLFTKDAIVLATDESGEFAEVDEVVGGTGDFAGATGRLVGTGTFTGGAGEGIVVGEICWP